MSTPKQTFLKDYCPPNYLIETTELEFKLGLEKTTVTATLALTPNPAAKEDTTLVLNGENMELRSVAIDDQPLEASQYQISPTHLTLTVPARAFTLTTVVEINPLANTALEGLYKSGSILCTQCEANGFRRITYYPDRPDVMSRFTTTIYADKNEFPTLLCNGNPVAQGHDENEHWVRWHDPHPKPCYLFALVAGELGLVKDNFISQSGRDISLEIYCDPGNEAKCQHAMVSLKKSMAWDEERFGREYDLDIYMIVAVDSFNMGAMENKGLNIFNSFYVLASQESATDTNFLGIEAVIAHEYFHNWTGNRITCRDWFQLTLKEGLTVFRDQCFSADMNSEVLKRIDDVAKLRNAQFSEDAGPTAHPIKPKSYVKMDNFYTPTVYEKGSEVIRMYYTMLGRDGFRAAMDYYFEKFDGQAITTEDFFEAMQSVSDIDLKQFLNWYDRAGTPRLDISHSYDAADQRLELSITQSLPRPEDADAEPLMMPFTVGLLDSRGAEMKLQCQNQPLIDKGILLIRERSETFVFEDVAEEPILSLNRDFSAPIKLHYERSDEEYQFLMQHDTDPFNRYEASQDLAKKILLAAIAQNGTLPNCQSYSEAIGAILEKALDEPGFSAKLLSIPSMDLLLGEQESFNFEATAAARKNLTCAIVEAHLPLIEKIYNQLNPENSLDPRAIEERELKNSLLYKLAAAGKGAERAQQQFESAANMTESMGALNALIKNGCAAEALASFYQKWNSQTLVMQKWLTAQAGSETMGTIATVEKLLTDPVYDGKVPNLVRSLIGAFGVNHLQFNKADGSGYRFFAEKLIEVDSVNPQIAARLAAAFRNFGKLPNELKEQMATALESVVATETLSDNVREIIELTLKSR